MIKGLRLYNKLPYPEGLWISYIYKEYEKYNYLLDIDTSLEDIIKIIKEKDLKYIIVPLLYNDKNIKILKKLDIKIIVIKGNPMRGFGTPAYKDYCINNNIDGMILESHLPIVFYKEWFDSDNIEFFYYKMGIPLDVYKDYGLEKTIDITHTGKFSTYLYRRELHDIFSNYESITYERFRQSNENQAYPNYIYAKKLNSSWISIGGCCQSIHKAYYNNILVNDCYPKNLEIAASKAALLTFDWGDRKYLGFKEDENCILFKSPRDALRKSIYYLDDKELLLKVIQKGYDLVHKNHNIVDTVNQLFNNIESKLL
jgi:hypothetical protein